VKAKRTQTFPKEERRFLCDSHATMGYIHIPICIRTTLCIVCAFKERRIKEGKGVGKGTASTCRALGCHNGVMLVFTFIAASRVSMISLTILSPWRCEREICKIFHCAKYRLSSQPADTAGFFIQFYTFSVNRFGLQMVCVYLLVCRPKRCVCHICIHIF